MKLEGKTALITGAGAGIGEAIALLFAEEGADIAVNDINQASAEKTAAAVKEKGRKAVAIKADVADEGEVDGMVDRVIAEMGRIDILVNNAGVGDLHGPLLDAQPPEKWDWVVNSILRGTYLCSRKVGMAMAEQKSGKVVNISSVAGTRGTPTLAAYSAAKAGVINLTKTLAADWGRYNINVNSIAPGLINTPLTRRTVLTWATVEQMNERNPLGRIGEALDIAQAALFLVSEEASYITGVVLPVDGGMSARG